MNKPDYFLNYLNLVGWNFIGYFNITLHSSCWLNFNRLLFCVCGLLCVLLIYWLEVITEWKLHISYVNCKTEPWIMYHISDQNIYLVLNCAQKKKIVYWRKEGPWNFLIRACSAFFLKAWQKFRTLIYPLN